MKSLLNKLFGDTEKTQLADENRALRERQFKQIEYIRKKTNQLLMLMGTLPIRPDELNDETLLELDPIGIVTDSFAQILEHEKELNETIRVAHDEIHAILASVGVGILVVDCNMFIQMYNHKILELFSIAEQELVGQTCSNSLCGCDMLPASCTFARIMETKRPVHQPDWVQNGRHFDVVGTPIRNRFGEITHVVLAYTDMTQRKESERRLREREQMYRELFENAHDLIQCVLPDGSFMFVNQAWMDVLGYTTDELAGLMMWNVISPENRKECMEHFACLLRGERLGTVRISFFSKAGKEIPVEGSVSCSFIDGKPYATLGIFRVLRAESASSMET